MTLSSVRCMKELFDSQQAKSSSFSFVRRSSSGAFLLQMFPSLYHLSQKWDLTARGSWCPNSLQEKCYWKSLDPTTQSSNLGTSFFNGILHPLTSARINDAFKFPLRNIHLGAEWVVKFYIPFSYIISLNEKNSVKENHTSSL